MSKMVGELERVGDEAKKIARIVIADTGRPAGATSRDAVHLGKLAHDLLRQALEAVDRLDFELTRGTLRATCYRCSLWIQGRLVRGRSLEKKKIPPGCGSRCCCGRDSCVGS